MNDMAGRMDTLLDTRDDISIKEKAYSPGDMLDEIHLWMAVDPLLASLHKQYLDAREQLASLTKNRDGRDPMAEIAADRLDSAQCAVDTRMLELRQSEEARSAVQAMIRTYHARRAAGLVAEERARSAQFWRNFSASKGRRNVQKRGVDSFFAMMIGVIALQQMVDQANMRLSIANMFSGLAAGSNRRLAAS